MKQIIDFLRQLAANNNREWFIAHKNEYQGAKAVFDAFAQQLIDGIRGFDDSIGPMAVKDCTYRIYRDVRFSADKSPYKIHMGAFIVPGGKKSGYSGYYFQIGAYDQGYPGGCMLASGDYCCLPAVLKVLREDISANPREFADTLKAADGFVLDWENALKRVPNGFPAGQPFSDWLRLKNFCLLKEPGLDYILGPGLLERTLEDFKRTMPFIRYINRAIEYTHQNF